jgi:transposase
MSNKFWLSDAQWREIDRLLPKNRPGAHRVDDRRIISGIVHVLKVGCRWQDCPSNYGPTTTVYNRFNRRARRGLWQRLFEALARAEPEGVQAIDSTTAKALRSAAGGKRGAETQAIGRSRGGRTTKIRAIADACGRPITLDVTAGQIGDVRVAMALIGAVPPARSLAGDTAYDSDGLRRFLLERGTTPVIPNNPTRKFSARSMMTSIANEMSSSECSAASRTGDALQPATTSSPPTSRPPSQSPPSSYGGRD